MFQLMDLGVIGVLGVVVKQIVSTTETEVAIIHHQSLVDFLVQQINQVCFKVFQLSYANIGFPSD